MFRKRMHSKSDIAKSNAKLPHSGSDETNTPSAMADNMSKSPSNTSFQRRSSMSQSSARNRSGSMDSRGKSPINLSWHLAILTKDNAGRSHVETFEDDDSVLIQFFWMTTCYELIPESGKLIALDVRLKVKDAYDALIKNNLRAAPMWNSAKQKFVGMLTISDFIKFLQRNYSNPSLNKDFEKQSLVDWLRRLDRSKNEKKLVWISPSDSVYNAITKLIVNKIHRLPVIDPCRGNVLQIITHKRILKYIHRCISELPGIYPGADLPYGSFLLRSIRDLGVGTHGTVVTAREDTTVIQAINIFVKYRISGIPIVDPSGKLVNIYSKFDVINVAAQKAYSNLDVTLREANLHRTSWFKGVFKCGQEESLLTVIDRLVATEVHRLVVVREDDSVCGMVSLSDVLGFLARCREARKS